MATLAAMSDLEQQIEALWARADGLSPQDRDAAATVEQAIGLLDSGQARVAEVGDDGTTVVHEWLKKAILLLFKLRAMDTIEVGPFEYADKLPLKRDFAAHGVRVVPGGSARWGSYLAPGVVLMPSYVNIGARVGEGSMVDTWATVGSCAQIGARVHLSGGVGIGGVLEPPNATPVVIEDDALVGSRCMVTQGARVGRGAVLGEGTILNPSIPVIDADTGVELSRGVVPAWCVAVAASRRREYPGGEFFLPCVLVIKRLTEGERHDKSQLNAVLREHGVSAA
jgi:2,3,4,5-tetrahydropyridine-2-carboxylate N-succinyltransferase